METFYTLSYSSWNLTHCFDFHHSFQNDVIFIWYITIIISLFPKQIEIEKDK